MIPPLQRCHRSREQNAVCRLINKRAATRRLIAREKASTNRPQRRPGGEKGAGLGIISRLSGDVRSRSQDAADQRRERCALAGLDKMQGYFEQHFISEVATGVVWSGHLNRK